MSSPFRYLKIAIKELNNGDGLDRASLEWRGGGLLTVSICLELGVGEIRNCDRDMRISCLIPAHDFYWVLSHRKTDGQTLTDIFLQVQRLKYVPAKYILFAIKVSAP